MSSNNLGDVAATLAVGVTSNKAFEDLVTLGNGLKSLKKAMVEFNRQKVDNPLKDLPEEAQQAIKTYIAEVKSGSPGIIKEFEKAGTGAGEGFVKKVRASMSRSGSVGGSTFGISEAITTEAAQAKIGAAKIVSEFEAVSRAARATGNTVKIAMEALTLKSSSAYQASTGTEVYRALEQVSQAEVRSASLMKQARMERVQALTAENTAIAPLREHYAKLSAESAKLNTETSRGVTHAKNATEATRAHAEAMRDGHSAARGLAAGFNAMWLTWGNIVPLMAGFALSASIRQAVEGFAQVQYQMTFVKGLAGEAGLSVRSLSKDMHDMSNSLGTDPEEAAKGLRALTQAGLSAGEAVGALPDVFKLATVGELSMADAAVSATGIVNAFNLSIHEIGRVGDVLAKAGSMSATSVSSMTESMRYASTVAHQYGVSLEEVSVILTALAKRNITGSAAGTATKNMLNELAAPQSSEGRNILKMLKFDAYDTSGAMKPILTQVEELRKALGQFNRPSQDRILRTLFGERGDKAFGALLATSKDQLQDYLKTLENSAGFTSNVFSQLQLTLKGQFDLTKSQILNTFSEIGEAGQGPLIDLLREIRTAFASEELKSNLRGLTQSVATLGRAAIEYGPTILALWASFKVAGAVTSIATSVGSSLMGLSASLMSATGMMGPTATGALGLRAAFMALNPIVGIGIGLVVTLAGAYFLLRERQESATEKNQREIRSIDDMVAAMRRENAELEKKISLRRKGAASDMIEAQGNLDDAVSARNTIESRLENARLRGGSEKDIKQLEKDLFKADQGLGAAEAEVNRRKRLMQEQKDMDAAEAKKRADEEAKNRPTGPREWEKGANPDAASLVSIQKSAALEAFKHAQELAKQNYDLEASLLDKKLEKGLVTNEEYVTARKALEGAYLRDVQDAEVNAVRLINAEKTKAQRQSQREQLDLAMKGINDKIVEEDRAHQLQRQKRLRESEIDLQAELQQLRAKDTPALAAKARFDTNKVLTTANADLISPEEKAALEARLRVEQTYQSKLDATNARIEEAKRLHGEEAQVVLDYVAAKQELINSMNAEVVAAESAAVAVTRYHESFEYGAKKAFNDYYRNANNAATSANRIFTTSVKGMEDALVNFVKTGKLQWRDFGNAVIDELIRIQAQKAIASVVGDGGGLLSWVGSIFGGSFGSASGAASTASSVPGFGGSGLGSGLRLNALGGAYGTAGEITAFAKGDAFSTNAILSSPTLFRFAKGGAWKLGVAGEAGDEAIMPLARDSAGRLGVRAQGGGGSRGGDTYMVTIQVNTETGATKTQGDMGNKGANLGKQLEAAVREVIIKEKRPNGLLAK